MDFTEGAEKWLGVPSGLLCLYWSIVSCVYFFCYLSPKPIYETEVSRFHLGILLWCALAGSFYLFHLLFNVTGHEGLRYICWFAFTVYMSSIYFFGMGISRGFKTLDINLSQKETVILCSFSAIVFIIHMLAFTEHRAIQFVLVAVMLYIFALQLYFTFQTMKALQERSEMDTCSFARKVFLAHRSLRVVRVLFVALGVLFTIECVTAYMQLGEHMKLSSLPYWVCYGTANSFVQTLMVYVSRPPSP